MRVTLVPDTSTISAVALTCDDTVTLEKSCPSAVLVLATMASSCIVTLWFAREPSAYSMRFLSRPLFVVSLLSTRTVAVVAP